MNKFKELKRLTNNDYELYFNLLEALKSNIHSLLKDIAIFLEARSLADFKIVLHRARMVTQFAGNMKISHAFTELSNYLEESAEIDLKVSERLLNKLFNELNEYLDQIDQEISKRAST